MDVTDWIGSIGVGLILIAFFCNTLNILSNQHKLFFILNLVGAALACYASYLIRYWPFVVLEATWTLVSIIGLIKTFKK